MNPTVLVLGGTGMLLPAVRTLAEADQHVTVVARHAPRAVADLPGPVTAIDAAWTDPEGYGHAIRAALGGTPVAAAIMWVHRPHRSAVTDEIAEVFSPESLSVRLWGSSTSDPRAQIAAEPSPAGVRLHEVILGRHRGPGSDH